MSEQKILIQPRNAAFRSLQAENFKGISCVSYNVLADIFCKAPLFQGLYDYCEPEVRAWDYRLQTIRAQLLAQSPDIICLQEVQLDSYVENYETFFAEHGYQFVLQDDKGRSAKCQTACAVLFKTSIFELACVDSRSRAVIVGLRFLKDSEMRPAEPVTEEVKVPDPSLEPAPDAVEVAAEEGQEQGKEIKTVESNDTIDVENKTTEGEEVDPKARYKKSFKKKKKSKGPKIVIPDKGHNYVWIGNCHLQGAPELTKIRADQMKSLLKNMTAHQKQKHCATAKSLSIVCGDFNASEDSGVYHMLSTGKLEKEFREVIHDKALVCATKNFSHDFKFESVSKVGLGREPDTFFVAALKRSALDFMFYTTPTLRAVACLEPVALKDDEFTPSIAHPSDHVSVGGMFAFV